MRCFSRLCQRGENSGVIIESHLSMEYLFGSSVPAYDVDGVELEECTAALSKNKPLLIGSTPFTLRWSPCDTLD